MRKQIAAANWKMNCDISQARDLLHQLKRHAPELKPDQQVVVAVPFPYLLLAKEILQERSGYFISAQNCHTADAGAYTGEVSAEMISSCGITHVLVGHSERREYNQETNEVLAGKVSQALKHGLTPIFCCGESLDIRETGNENQFVSSQIEDSLFGLTADEFSKVVIAYEPIWAIGTGKTATADQAQQMHAHIRETVAGKFGENVAGNLSILYGGSVKADNASEIFGKPDVDGGLVGGASLKANDFITIIKSLKG